VTGTLLRAYDCRLSRTGPRTARVLNSTAFVVARSTVPIASLHSRGN
jgi:hypothetical protein